MKNIIVILILTIIFNHQMSYAQHGQPVEFDAGDLIGVWYLKYNSENDHLTFEKPKTIEHKYGSRIELFKNGDFHNRYSAPCGNDTRLRTHNYRGKWNLNEKEWIITTTEPINRKGTIYKIVELKKDKLILAEIKTE